MTTEDNAYHRSCIGDTCHLLDKNACPSLRPTSGVCVVLSPCIPAAGGSGPWLPPPFALDRHLRVTNHPLPLTAADSAALDTFLTVLAAIFVLVPFCYLAGGQRRARGAGDFQRRWLARRARA